MKESLEGKKKTAVCDDAKALPAQERESNHTGNPVPEKESESKGCPVPENKADVQKQESLKDDPNKCPICDVRELYPVLM